MNLSNVYISLQMDLLREVILYTDNIGQALIVYTKHCIPTLERHPVGPIFYAKE